MGKHVRGAARYRTRKEKEAARQARIQRMREEKMFHSDEVIRKFEEAYEAARGQRAPRVDYVGGWYVVRHSPTRVSRKREVDIVRKTRALWGAAHAREMDEPEEAF